MQPTVVNETFGELFRRHYIPPLRSGVPSIDQSIGLHTGQCIEISGPHHSGKTKLLIQIAARCILPKEYGGLQSRALYIDLDHKMDISLLIKFLQKHIQGVHYSQKSTVKILKCVDEVLMENCLERFQLLTCDSSLEFLAALKALPKILLTQQETNPVGCVLVDNIAAFYWADKAASALQEEVPLTLQKVQQCVFRLMQSLHDAMHVPVVISKNTLTQVKQQGTQMVWEQREIIHSQLQKIYTQRLILVLANELPEYLKAQWRPIGHNDNLLIKSTV